MSDVTVLNCGWRDVTTLVGIEQFLELHTYSDEFGDPLSDHDLYLLSQLPSLEVLGIRMREVTNLALVSNFDSPFTSLKTLDLADTDLSDLKWVSLYPHLEEILLDGNMIKDFSPLTGLLNLEEVWLGGHSVYDQLDFIDYDVLESIQGLSRLTLYYTKNTDVERVSRLVNINELALNGTDVTDISSLANLNGLKSLRLYDVDSNFRSELLNNLDRVTKLELYNSDIPLSDISEMPLEALILNTMKLDGIEELKGMKGLNNLTIINSNVKDISVYGSLVGLTKLDFQNNKIVDISSLATLHNLEELNLDSNDVEDISPLYGLKKLKLLNLQSLFKLTCYQVKEIKHRIPSLVIKGKSSCF
jgi:internalin A